jgi:hypothetical protein
VALTPIEEIAPRDAASFDAEVRPAHRPVVIRGAARAVAAGRARARSPDEALGYLKSLDTVRRPK